MPTDAGLVLDRVVLAMLKMVRKTRSEGEARMKEGRISQIGRYVFSTRLGRLGAARFAAKASSSGTCDVEATRILGVTRNFARVTAETELALSSKEMTLEELWVFVADLEAKPIGQTIDTTSWGVVVPANDLLARFPGGGWVPPPPPGMGGAPPDASGAYWVDRPWGQLWFAFLSGDRLAKISVSPGARGSPGV